MSKRKRIRANGPSIDDKIVHKYAELHGCTIKQAWMHHNMRLDVLSLQSNRIWDAT